jgi:hypothetical protein
MSTEQFGAGEKAHTRLEDTVETFADGHVDVRHGRVNLWLVIVYAVMFAWAIYYGFVYWGGLGPGLDY